MIVKFVKLFKKKGITKIPFSHADQHPQHL